MSGGQQHDFVVVIPVADRPRHLADCLDSLITLRERYPYDGAITVLIADDSREQASIDRHRALCEALAGSRIDGHYLGQQEQLALINDLPFDLRARLSSVLGEWEAVLKTVASEVGSGAHGTQEPECATGHSRIPSTAQGQAGKRSQFADGFSHKGASITRNLAYLWLARLQRDGRRRLFWFIDSDQEFRVNVETAAGEDQPYAVDYFHWLDRIFRETEACILTGKVVGDPPVSPAVMAGTCLDDVTAFLARMATLAPQASCSFHGAAARVDDAAYHDMAELFGFKAKAAAYRYRCPIQGTHDHAACLADFAGRLNRFFDGEHPTRRSYHEASDPLASLQPARTVYTGNYVFTPEGLTWFIPFAGLRLRMAGPTLGRIVRAELGPRFVSANLPMLHKRTVGAIGQSEFRPGVAREQRAVDLSGEYERQYFGDVMLFAMERLTALGYPAADLDTATLADVVSAVETEMHAKYQAKQAEVATKLAGLGTMFEAAGSWWRQSDALEPARADFRRFLANMADNFGDGSLSWRRVDDSDRRRLRRMDIVRALGRYRDDRAAWGEALERI